MDDFAQLLTSEQTNQNALLIEILTVNYSDYEYIIAVEGDDDVPFYYDFVYSISPDKSILFQKCNCKAAVLKLKAAVESYEWQDPPKFRYLCDKDFDDYNDAIAEGVWYTNWYSIESYISCQEFVSYVIAKHSRGTITHSELKKFFETYGRILAGALRTLRPFAALMCELKADGQCPQFDEFGIEQLFDLRKGALQPKRHKLAAALTAISADPTVSMQRLISRSRKFHLNEWQCWLRGKLALQLCRKIYSLSGIECNLQGRLPRSDALGGTALEHAFNFWRELPGLRSYVLGE
jgi:hypothetical protein